MPVRPLCSVPVCCWHKLRRCAPKHSGQIGHHIQCQRIDTSHCRQKYTVHRCEFCVHLVNQFGQALAARRNAKLVGSLGGNFGHRLCPCQILPVGVRRNADGDSFFVNLLSDTRGVFYFSSSAFFVPAMLQRRVRTIISPYCHPIL